MWSLLWLAWCWFVTLTWSADERCGQPSFSCHALPVSVGVPMMLHAFLSDFGDSGLWLPSPVPLRCLMISATPLFRSHALLVSVGVPMMLDVLLLVDFGDAGLWLPLPVPLRCLMIFAILTWSLVEVYSRSLLPSWLCLGGSFHPFPCLAPGLGMVYLIGLLGLVPLCLACLPPTAACLVTGG
ncbi:hypothetical protein GQ457_03G017030 [Hibiscus cannabinus]